ncbi:MAG TPA: DUF3291 domain-containing protein [Anaerolineales bacterium]|nr:DUF3291 domain-containing protein [Anaerolineales bacterium]
MNHHLAQLNLAKPRFPLDDPRMAEFMENLNRINELGKAAPGFVWILEDDTGNATAIHAFDDPDILINLTVWESVESLRDFAYRTEHVDYVRRRHEWFEPLKPYLVLWWVPAGHIPTIEESKDRMAALARSGPNPGAFTLSKIYPPEA